MESSLDKHAHFEPCEASAEPTYTVPAETVKPSRIAKDPMSKALRGEAVALSQLTPQTTFLPPADDGKSLIE